MPERIKETRDEYEAALEAADGHWDRGHLDFTRMEVYLAALLEAQLTEDGMNPNPGGVA